MTVHTKESVASVMTTTRISTRKDSGKQTVSTSESFTRVNGKFVTPSSVVVNTRQSDGYRSPSPYSGVTETLPLKINVDLKSVNSSGAFAIVETIYSGAFAGSINTPYSPVLTEQALRDELRTKVLINLKDEVFDVAMVLAEMQGTVTTLASNLYRLGRSMDAVRRRKPEPFHYLMHGRRFDNRRPTDKFLRETAGTYLEWKYGIMPTVYDIQGATRALDINEKGSLWDNPPLMVSRAAVKRKTSRKSGLLGSPFVLPDGVLVEAHEYGSARVDFSVNAEGIRGLSRYGIGLGTLGTVLFDRTPFSFVLNMALPIADLIKAWTSLSGGVNVRGYSETFYVKHVIPSGVILLPAGNLSYEKNESHFSFKRNGSTQVPMPLPFIRNPLKAGNMATVLALFTQLRSKSGSKTSAGV